MGMPQRRALIRAAAMAATTLLFGAAPVKEGSEVYTQLGGGHYENAGCGRAALMQHRDARLGVKHGFADSGMVAVVESGVAGENEIAVQRYQEDDESDADFAARSAEPLDRSTQTDYLGGLLVRGGYQWKYVGFELGPFFAFGGGAQPFPFPSAVARFTLDGAYVYGALLDEALPRSPLGAGFGMQTDKVRLDLSARLGVASGLRLQTDLPVGKRLWLGGSTTLMGRGHVYDQWNGYLHVSYRFDDARRQTAVPPRERAASGPEIDASPTR